MTAFTSLEAMVVAAADGVRPPERITVSEAAERYHIVKNPGQHEGPFSLDKTPYLREPMDVLTSLDFTGMAFCGPARTGKSAMAINWLCHTAITDPADMMFVHMAQHTARDWSQADLQKALRNSEDLRKRLSPARQDDNTYDKRFLSGMRAIVTWPTITNLSGKTIPRLWIMDMDRIKPQVIEKEGHVFDLTRKRAGTFKRYGMTAAEASPGFPVTDPKWIASSPHEAPPCEGILSIYNRGDRRRWYWNCPHCAAKFEPRFGLLRWEEKPDIMDAADTAHLPCPKCGSVLTPDLQRDLNLGGRWIKEGQTWQEDGSITGTPRRSDIASFWLFGPAAGFTDWKQLVREYLRAQEEYERLGDDAKLMTTVTVDQGEAYVPPALLAGRLPEELKRRAEDWGGSAGEPVVPSDAEGGFLIATIDVQAGARPSFVVHVFLVNADGIAHVDMFKIRKSERLDEDGERHLLNPASHSEDWDLLIPQVLERDYPLGDGSGRRLQIKIVGCDSGGAGSTTVENKPKKGDIATPKVSVTSNAYQFYRRLRGEGLDKRFHLLKGSPSRTETAPIRVSYPDAQQKDRLAIARGDVPVWLVNSNIVKDQVSNMLGREDSGGRVRFPTWAEDWLYTQLTTEVRTGKGWENPSRRRNEAFDLLAYAVALLRHPDLRTHVAGFWDAPPPWAGQWDANPLVYKPTPEGGRRFEIAERQRPSLGDLAESLG